MKFRKGAVADVLWFIALTTIFIIVTRSQLEFSNTATIDTYAKNIINTEVTSFVNVITGFSKYSTTLNMYNSKGVKRELGNSSEIASSLDSETATAYGIVNLAKNNMIQNIKNEFENNYNLKTRTKGIDESNINVEIIDNPGDKSAMVTVTVSYTVVGSNYESKNGGLFQESKMEIPRKVIVTRTIENPLRFR